MIKRVLIIGGYGNFGSHIARKLADHPAIRLIIAGRSPDKARAMIAALAGQVQITHAPEAGEIDIYGPLEAHMAALAPDIVIHTTGPFQNQDYRVASAAIACGAHYIDLADARHFVTGIAALDEAAREANVLLVSGASSVPCLTAAVIDSKLPDFSRLESIDYGISAAQQTNRGLATTAAVLSYVGRPFTTLQQGAMRRVHGWEETRLVRYPQLGWRMFGHCEIPDQDLFPARYPDLKDMRFAAGHELKILHIGTRVCGFLVRMGLLKSLDHYAEKLLGIARLFDPLGSGKSGFHMFMRGVDHQGRGLEKRYWIIARSAHGPYIPCIPSILLARWLAEGRLEQRGARPCLDLIDLERYTEQFAGLDIEVIEE